MWDEPAPSPGDAAEEHDWLDRDAGPLVRAYTVTGGRVRASTGIDLVAFVVAEPIGEPLDVHLQPEHRAILAMTEQPLSVAEIASRLDLAVGVVRVLIGDLLADGLVALYEPEASQRQLGETVLKAVIDELRTL